MNPRRGWNPDFEEPYPLEYSEYESETFTKVTSSIYIFPVKVSAPDPSPISRYSEYTKTTSFSIFRVFKHETLIFNSYSCSTVSAAQ